MLRPCDGGTRTFLVLDLAAREPHLPGMSGAPVLVEGDPADGGTDLGDLAYRRQAIEPGHQRVV
jgi:hypothetical protein